MKIDVDLDSGDTLHDLDATVVELPQPNWSRGTLDFSLLGTVWRALLSLHVALRDAHHDGAGVSSPSGSDDGGGGGGGGNAAAAAAPSAAEEWHTAEAGIPRFIARAVRVLANDELRYKPHAVDVLSWLEVRWRWQINLFATGCSCCRCRAIQKDT